MHGQTETRSCRAAAAVFCVMASLAVGCAPQDSPAPRPESQAALEPAPPPEFALPPVIAPLPPPSIEPRAKIELGKSLFNDSRLSRDGSLRCASCHDLSAGGDDGRTVSVGLDGRTTAVNAPTVLNSALNFAQFWDGRVRTLEEQIRATVEHPIEMGGDWQVIERRLRADSALSERFGRIYDDGVKAANVIDALAAYLRALLTPNSPFDRYLRGQVDAVPEAAKEGYELFVRLGCVSCHQGRNVGGNLFQRFGVMGDYFAERGAVTAADYGRFNVTGREEDRYVFKVPTLRNAADTAPYFHDGSVATLDEAVALMARYQLGRPVGAEQVEQLVAFLESLSGEVARDLL